MSPSIKAKRIGNAILLQSALVPRKDWAQAFEKMASKSDDALLDEEAENLFTWDQAEWRW